MIHVAVAGAGRMGKAIAAGLETRDDMALAGLWGRDDDLDALVADADVLIDFSLPEATTRVIDAAVRHGKPLVCGVSGLHEDQTEALAGAAGRVPVVYDRNMSLGVAVLMRVVGEVAASLGPDFAVRIEEVHHVHKKDAPSGTALKLGEAVAAARGEEGTGAVEFHSERRGDVPGDHEVILSSPTERLSFAHRVTTRQVFADGAIRAARWIVCRAPGLYDMGDVLFADSPFRA